jgi:uncharacterized protein
MQAQETDLITGLFGRLQQFEAQPRDPEAESLISGSVARQPAAPYLLVQTVLVQEQALKAAQERIAELEAKVSAAPAVATSFLGSVPKISPWGTQHLRPTPPVPSTRSPLQAAVAPAAAPAGGSFLRTAMMTAAGVAGGALLFEGIRGLMGSNPGPFGQAAAAPPAPAPLADAQQQAMAQDTGLQDQGLIDQGGAPDDSYDTASDDSGFGGGDDDSFA